MMTENTFFDELRSALDLMPHTDRVLDALNRTYRRFLDAHTRMLSISLVGPFAQTDYLLKEHKASKKVRRAIHDVRVAFHQPQPQIDVNYAFQALVAFFEVVEMGVVSQESSSFLDDKKPDTPAEPVEGLATVTTPLQYLRFLLTAWDEQYLYGNVDAHERDEAAASQDVVRVAYARHFAYLRPMLSGNMQFNLIRCKHDGDTLVPELIILEPDYLVNVTSIAHCFETYDESPYVHLLDKIKPNAATEHTILGHLAGQLLDEELHGAVPYQQSASTFFHQHASSLLTTPLPPDFHARAQQQGRHIHQAIGQVLPQEVGAFRREDVLLEASFYSEMLGLQGRMDLLQHDMKVLIEQKAGKGAFVPGNTDPDTPRPAEQHYVQMLLYMLLIRYNYPEAYAKGSEGMQAFLLYSKYANSLVKLDFSPELVHRAIRIRNGIAWMDNELGKSQMLQDARWTWRSLLLPLTPEALNTKGCHGHLWTDYKRPELARLLAPIHNATPLERSYCLRLLQFISREHLLAKVGNKNRQNAGFAAAWHDSLSEKRQAGNIYDGLKLKSVSPLTFHFSDTACNDMANFRLGDIVVLYPYQVGTEPDIRRTMVHRASIEEITADCISLRLRAEQTDAEVFLRHQDDAWAIEHDHMEASFSSLYRGTYAFLSAPQSRRDLLLMQRQPSQTPTAMIRGEYGSFNELMLRVKRADDFFLIIGPPGTGKTSFGMLNTLREELTEPDSRILLVSYTNRAVDEICSKLVEESIDFVRLGSTLSCAPEYHSYLFTERVTQCRGIEAVRQLFLTARVVCATTTSATSHLDMLCLKPFSLCIIDEASQILEPHLLGLLGASVSDGSSTIRKFVMIGDHKQLPAVVQQSADDARVVSMPFAEGQHTADERKPEDGIETVEEADSRMLAEVGLYNCRSSLFERLLSRYRNNPDVVYMLTRQGRMHHDIAEFPNQAFYGGHLTEVPLPHQLVGVGEAPSPESLSSLLSLRVAFIDVPRPRSSVSDKVNQPEAELIASMVKLIYDYEGSSFEPERTIGVIVPYRNQIATVRNTIERLVGREASQITIDTVERYQGSQRRYIIYGFTVQQPYQLDFLTDNTFEEDGSLIDRKLNVAMTRAMEHLFLVGNRQLLQRAPVFARLFDSIPAVSPNILCAKE